MKRLILILVVLISGCFSQNFEASETLEFVDRVDVGELDIDFETYNGKITLRTWDRKEYKITVKKRAWSTSKRKAERKLEKIEVNFSKEKEREIIYLRLEIKSKETFSLVETSAEITAYIPSDLNFKGISLKTINGEIYVENVSSESLKMRTTNGELSIFNVNSRKIDAKTTNGKISSVLEGEMIELETVNGEIDVTIKGKGSYNLKTTNGGIEIRLNLSCSFDLENTHGEIEVYLENVTFEILKNHHVKGYNAEKPEVFILAETINGDVIISL
ncbi:MAG: DUF4097 domain-containing protein [Candidatus Methanofastidiosia archaeon]